MIAIRKLAVVILMGNSLALWADDCTPSEKRAGPSITSPDGRYRILNVLCADGDDERGALVLLKNGTDMRRTIYTYSRHVTALWSPDGQNIAINDYAGSDFTNNVVLSVNQRTPRIDLKKEVLESEPGHDIPKADHLYMSSRRWRSENELELIAWGHGEEARGGFCRCFSVSLDGKVRQCDLHNAGSDPKQYCEKIKK